MRTGSALTKVSFRRIPLEAPGRGETGKIHLNPEQNRMDNNERFTAIALFVQTASAPLKDE
jgi:hypothetical protein